MFTWEKEYIPEWLWAGNKRRTYWILTRGLAVAAAVSGFYFLIPSMIILTGLPSLDDRGYLLATNIFASALLTFALIAVYRDIGETQSEQANIQKNQELLMEVGYEPIISVHKIDAKGDILKLLLSNDGNGVAKDLGYTVLVEPISDEESLQYVSVSERSLPFVPLERKFGSSNTLPPNPDDPEQFDSPEEVFVSPQGFAPSKHGREPFSQYTERLSREGVTQLAIQIRIGFDHLMPTRGYGCWYSRYSVSEINGKTSLEDVLDRRQSSIVSPEIIQSETSSIRQQGTYYGESDTHQE